MRDEEWKVLGEHAAFIAREESAGRANGWQLATLAAYRELKQRQEDEEWCHANAAVPVFYRHGVNMRIAGEDKIYEGPTLHQAIQTAKEEK